MSSKVASGALLHARSRGAERIFCGHTHEALQQQQDGVQYYNAGGWIDSRQTYITVGSDGVQIHEYHERLDEDESGKERGETDDTIAEFTGESGLPEDAEYENIGG
jgi:hypothetical protein